MKKELRTSLYIGKARIKLLAEIKSVYDQMRADDVAFDPNAYLDVGQFMTALLEAYERLGGSCITLATRPRKPDRPKTIKVPIKGGGPMNDPYGPH
jgi:hypothetical protein